MLLGYANVLSKTSHAAGGVQGECSRQQVLKSIKRFESKFYF